MIKENVENKLKWWNKWDVIYVEIFFFIIYNLIIKGLGIENIIDYFEINMIEEEGLLKIKCKN